MRIRAVHTRIFREDENLVSFILKAIPKIREGSVLAVTSKIVALAEGRTVLLKSEAEKARVIRAESSWQSRVTAKWWLSVRDGTVVVNAGIDDSNADGKTVLLPQNSFDSAETLRKKLMRHYQVKRLGIVITDSRISPLRAGVTGVALGYAGFKGIRDYRGTRDIFRRKMTVTQTSIADCLATSAVFLMGEGNEQCPLALIENAPVKWTGRVNRRELQIPMKDDLYKRLFRK